jgi:hypothetical protein
VPNPQLPVALAVVFYRSAAERLADAAEDLVRIWSSMVKHVAGRQDGSRQGASAIARQQAKVSHSNNSAASLAGTACRNS